MRGGTSVVGRLLFTTALLWGATALRADTFSFSYSGNWFGNVANASGTITATATLPGIYTITGLTGTLNGVAVSLAGTGFTFIYSGGTGTGNVNFLKAGIADPTLVRTSK